MSEELELKKIADAVKATAEAVDAVASTLSENATRSVILEVDNTTSRTLILHDHDHVHGGFRQPPPFSIEPTSNGLFTSESGGLATGTQGHVQYRLDDEGTIFHLEWDNPFLGSNKSDCRVEGTHADFYIVDHVTGAGNTRVHMPFLLAERVAIAPRQPDWMTCGKCKVLFFAPQSADSDCPAGGNHAAAGLNFRLPHDIPGPNHQPEWRTCHKCKGMFFNGDPFSKGVCPAPVPAGHEAAGIVFLIPHSGADDVTHQTQWRFCDKCRGLFFAPQSADSHCPAGGNHAAAGLNFRLPHDIVPAPGTHQPGWQTCGKCKVLFFAPQSADSDCPAGGNHAAAGFVFQLPHDVPEPGDHQPEWRTCHKCKGMFFNGDPFSKGVCPAPVRAGHESAGFVFHLPHDLPGPGQSDWRFCDKCFGLFFEPHNAQGVCPAGGNHNPIGNNFRLDHA